MFNALRNRVVPRKIRPYGFCHGDFLFAKLLIVLIKIKEIKMKELESIRELFLEEINKVLSHDDLNNLRVNFLGKRKNHLTVR